MLIYDFDNYSLIMEENVTFKQKIHIIKGKKKKKIGNARRELTFACRHYFQELFMTKSYHDFMQDNTSGPTSELFNCWADPLYY